MKQHRLKHRAQSQTQGPGSTTTPWSVSTRWELQGQRPAVSGDPGGYSLLCILFSCTTLTFTFFPLPFLMAPRPVGEILRMPISSQPPNLLSGLPISSPPHPFFIQLIGTEYPLGTKPCPRPGGHRSKWNRRKLLSSCANIMIESFDQSVHLTVGSSPAKNPVRPLLTQMNYEMTMIFNCEVQRELCRGSSPRDHSHALIRSQGAEV